ncbi:MAG: UDP-N-acetylmuramate--L-alanine ligase [Candidatus Coatesbacteria bacterium]|nr:MAG: UDP-N-acetylmuramate--L-alanine ligase [Candidatus Coatesbacteria bacterium]
MRIFGPITRIHMIGIGGAGMCGIAEILVNLGFTVTGSDLALGEATERLEKLGVPISYGHGPGNVGDAEVVVKSSAIPDDNPELVAARKLGLPIIRRAEMLAELMRMKKGIAVCGTHGKTTLTSILAELMAAGGLDPTYVIGGRLNSAGVNAKLGDGEYLVAEADESDGSFLRLSPIYVILTNVDEDHLDYYGDFDAVKRAFAEFVDKVPFYGLALVCADDSGVREIIPEIQRPYYTYGTEPGADVVISDITYEGLKTSFNLAIKNETHGSFTINLPGKYSAFGAGAAAAMAILLGVGADAIRDALDAFAGVEMRFQEIGRVGDIIVIHDYAHHPKELATALAALRVAYPGRRFVTVFQPHRYTRTMDQLENFGPSLMDTDAIIITSIYAAGESEIEGVAAEAIADDMKRRGHKAVEYIAEKGEVAARVAATAESGDVLVHLGAGDVWKIAAEVVERLEGKR